MPTDIRLAIRSLLRTPSFTLVAGLVLAIGIGANTAVFSVLNAVLLRPLPYRAEERVASVYNRWQGQPQAAISPAEYFDYLDRTHDVFESFGAWSTGSVNITGGDRPERVAAAFVSAGVLPALGISPSRGRAFTSDEDAAGGAPVALLSDELWRTRYAASEQAVGGELVVNGQAATIVGVLPPEFALPTDFGGDPAQLLLPLALDRATSMARGSHFLAGVARLAPSITMTRAQSRLDEIAADMVATYPDDYPRDMHFGAWLISVHDDVAGSVRPALLVLLGAVGLVLLIACANVAGLTLTRADARRREFAVRSALGAGRAHIARQLLAESVTLAVAGGAAGIVVAMWGLGALLALLPPGLPRADAVTLDVRVLAFAAAITLLTALVFGLAPLLQMRGSPSLSMRDGGRGATSDRTRQRYRQTLASAEMAVAVVLLAGAGLLVRTLTGLFGVDPGYVTENVLTTRLTLPPGGYETAEQRWAFYAELADRAGRLPGIVAAGAATNLPLTGTLGDINIRIEGREVSEGEVSPALDWQAITPGYFDAMGMRLVHGRGITAVDDARSTGVVVLNEAAARAHFGSSDEAMGRRFVLGGNAGPGQVTVIGIVTDIRHSGLDASPRPEMYLAHAQFTFWNGGSAARTMSLVARTSGDPAATTPAVRSLLADLDPALPAGAFRTMADVRSQSIAGPRFLAALVGSFAAVALLLATVGIYGMIAFGVALRRKEIGVRMALGARGAQVVGLVLRQGLVTAALGITIGAVAAILLSRFLEGLLYAIEPGDPTTMIAVVALLASTAAAACIVPARRALRVEPGESLRTD